MPELPDLEVFRGNVFDRIADKRLTGLEVCAEHKVQAAQALLREQLVGRDLLGIGRVGKELMFDFGEGRIIAAHLMLNGEMSIVAPGAVAAVRHKIFALVFGEQALVFADRGALCTIKYQPPASKVPDAFDEAFTQDYFLAIAGKKTRMNVKSFLIDQKIIKGIGNAYADEILWAAKVSPHSVMGGMPREVLVALYEAIDPVLRGAIEGIRRGDSGRISGEDRNFLQVHTKARKETVTGHPIIVATVASKITYYTREQVVYL